MSDGDEQTDLINRAELLQRGIELLSRFDPATDAEAEALEPERKPLPPGVVDLTRWKLNRMIQRFRVRDPIV
jgi:hypothetical protein